MKKIFLFVLVLGSLATAQTIDMLNFAIADSVDIKALVQKQIDEARAKQMVDSTTIQPIVEAKIEIPLVKNIQTEEASSSLVGFLLRQPVQYLIYEVASFLIIGLVLLSRIIKNFGKNSKKNLKIKIGLMREEKVGGSKVNLKMIKIRKVLKDNLEIFRQDDQQLARTARQLNVSRGELLLAARLKIFEMKKM